MISNVIIKCEQTHDLNLSIHSSLIKGKGNVN